MLDVRWNDIGDDGMAVISEALQNNKSLTTLNVSECGLSVKGNVVCGFNERFSYILQNGNKHVFIGEVNYWV